MSFPPGTQPANRQLAAVTLPAPARAGLTVAGLTATAAILGGLFPGLASGGDPHPVLHGTIAEAADIAATNLRVLSAPFLLALLGLHHAACRRRIGDLAIAILATLNTVQVGLALGADGPRLIPYVPQLPLEWTALTLCLAAWLDLRTGDAAHGRIGRYAAATLALTVTAAAVETFATPHSNPQTHGPTAGSVSRSAVSPVWEAGVRCHQRDCPPGRPDAARSLTLPSPRSVAEPVRSRTANASATGITPSPNSEISDPLKTSLNSRSLSTSRSAGRRIDRFCLIRLIFASAHSSAHVAGYRGR